MCPECEDSVELSQIDIYALVDKNKSLEEARSFFQLSTWVLQLAHFPKSGFFDVKKPLKKVHERGVEQTSSLETRRPKATRRETEIAYEGLNSEIQTPLPGQRRGGDGTASSPSFDGL